MTGHELVRCAVLFDVQLLQQSGSGPNTGALSNLGNLGLGESVFTLLVMRLDKSYRPRHPLHTCFKHVFDM